MNQEVVQAKSLVIQCNSCGAITRTHRAVSLPKHRIHSSQAHDLTLRPVSFFFGSFFNVLDAPCDPNGFIARKEVVHYWTLAGGIVSGGSHTSGSRKSRSRRQARSRGELFPRRRTQLASRSTSLPDVMMPFRKPMNCIQNLVQSTAGFHRRHSCTFGPSQHKLPRSIRFSEPPQPSGECKGSCELGLGCLGERK
jgi:hypothetical protein